MSCYVLVPGFFTIPLIMWQAVWLECTQEQNEIIFVPSGWYHQVHNLVLMAFLMDQFFIVASFHFDIYSDLYYSPGRYYIYKSQLVQCL